MLVLNYCFVFILCFCHENNTSRVILIYILSNQFYFHLPLEAFSYRYRFVAKINKTTFLISWVIRVYQVLYWSFHCYASRERNSLDKVQKLQCYKRKVKEALLQVLGLFFFPNLRYSSKCFALIYRAQYGAAMLVIIFGPPTWRPEIVKNIWNLLWLSSPLVI